MKAQVFFFRAGLAIAFLAARGGLAQPQLPPVPQPPPANAPATPPPALAPVQPAGQPPALPRSLSPAKAPSMAPPAAQPLLVWDAMTKEYTAKPGETTNMFVFSVTNAGPNPISIEGLKPSCGCTVAKLPHQPWRLLPGEGGDTHITINFAGKYGLVTKLIRVDASQEFETQPTQKFVQTLMIKVNIPGQPAAPASLSAMPAPGGKMDRTANVEMAKADRQAVFKGDCASCHAVPTRGKMGEQLYTVACAICHDSPNRAQMVPELAHLNKSTDENFWRGWISFGKGGTLMPGFADRAGGPLTRQQIDSLAVFLAKKYPSPTIVGQLK